MTNQVFEPLRENDPRTAGGYRLRARVGAGGMGQVFLSFSPGGRPVAVKMLWPQFAEDPAFRARFAQEVRAAQQVNGIYIAQLLDADPAATPPWLASAYIPGPSLAEAVRLAGPLPVPVVANLAGAVAKALQAVHAARIIHRDLKPNNVILGTDGPRVIDFGVARATDGTHLTLSGSSVGSPQYMSPEQVRGRPTTPATDVFALGAVMYHVATGRQPFGEGPDFDIVLRIHSGVPPLTGCPPELRGIISACMASEPMDRPTLEEVIAACAMPGLPLPPALAQAIQTRQAAVSASAAEPVPAVPEHVTGPLPSAAHTGTGPLSPAALTRTGSRPSAGRGRTLIVAGAAGLVLAGAGLGAWAIQVLNGGGGGAQPQQSQPASNQAALPATSTPQSSGQTTTPPASSTPEPSTPPAEKVQWSGTIRFNDDGIDLDTVPPAVDPSTPEDLREALSAPLSQLHSQDGMMRVWTEAGEPTPQQCREIVSTQGSDRAKAVKGDYVCVITDEERVAVLKVVKFPTDFSGVVGTVKVWELTESD
ncbi:protein kinase domain-containing protein [Nonomuraea sp. NPDC002799]